MKIVCIGSSSVEGIGDKKGIGWVGRMQQSLQIESDVSKYRVFNLGFKGEFLSKTVDRYKTEALYRRPHLVIIFAGSNDCVTHIKDGKVIKQPNTDEYVKKWNDFLKVLSVAEHKTIILGPTMVNSKLAPVDYKDMKIGFKNSDLQEYNRNLKFLAEQYKVPFFELFNLFAKDIDAYSFDFVHPNEKGYDLIFEKLMKFLKENKYV